jgi:predicted secreted protein
MAVVKGNNIFVFWNDGGSQQLIGGTRSNEISSQADSIEIASATQQDWEEFIAGRRSWGFTGSFLLLSENRMADLLKAGNFFTIQIKGTNAGVILEGTAMLESERYTVTENTLANGSLSFKGSGPLTIPSSGT